MRRHAPDWTAQRRQHRSLLRADRAGLQHLVEFAGRNTAGHLVLKVWSKTRPLRHVVQATDAGEVLTCTCEYRSSHPDADPCAHMGAAYLFLHPEIKAVKPLPTVRERQSTPKDRDWRNDPETRSSPLQKEVA